MQERGNFKQAAFDKLKQTAKDHVPKEFLGLAVYWVARMVAGGKGLSLTRGRDHYEVSDQAKRRLRVSDRHGIYLLELISSFDYYFSAISPEVRGESSLVDYSGPRFHEVVGYDLHPVYFPSFAEPVHITAQYLDFAQLENGSVVLDLGAYSGLTSILFDREVGPEGKVVAVEADAENIKGIHKNFDLYGKIAGRRIALLEGAVWEHGRGLEFSTEGTPGSSAAHIVGGKRGPVVSVPSFTLSGIVEAANLTRVDFIKCDVEGAESIIFKDEAFFKRFRPRMVIEPHMVDSTLTVKACVDALAQYGYRCVEVPQQGYSTLPLLECTPL